MHILTSPLNFFSHRFILSAALILFCCINMAWAGDTDATDPDDDKASSLWVSPIRMFQRIISRADGQRCPMYPSDSNYATQAFNRFGPLIGWVLTSDRLLRCGRDETRLSPAVKINGLRSTYDPIEANTFWWDDH